MATKNNPGQGGFVIDGKVHVFDTGDPDAPGIIPVDAQKSVVIDKSPKDISKETKKTLADYLGRLTSEAKNKYPIQSSPQEDVSITSKEGNAIGPSSFGETQNDPQFANRQEVTSTGKTSPDLKSSDKYIQIDPAREAQLTDTYSIGRSNVNLKNGNDLLKEVQKNKLPDPIKKYTSAVLKNNRFTSELPRATAADDYDGVISETQFLPNDPKSILKGATASNIQLQHPQYGSVSLNRLAQVGNTLSLRASTELNSFNPGNNPTGGIQDAAALLPGLQQLGTSRVDTVLLEAKDILDNLTQEEINSGDLISINDLSWGSLNNVSDPFSGIQSIGMVALSIALTSALIVVFEGLGGLLSLVSPGEVSPAIDMNSGKWIKGKYRTDSADTSGGLLDISAAALGIRSTVYPLGECIQRGVERFFGLTPSSGGGIGSAVGNAIESAVGAVGGDGLLAPGHNVVICRTIIRSSVTIADAFRQLTNTPTIVSGARDVLNIVDTIRRSKIIAAINVFASLGDAYLSNLEFAQRTNDSSVSPYENHNHRIRLDNDRNNERLKLSWASNRAPSMYLIPDSILSLSVVDTKLGSFKGPLGLNDELSKTKFVIQNVGDIPTANAGRINSTGLDVKEDGTGISVEYFEKILDSEYVPFYFHDLRTNEIIAFHAFLTQLSENYTPKWESSAGIGRIDPVSVYTNTERKFDIGFYVVATSENDFDDMWVKINKLITLVYPQYTKGRQFEGEDGTKFIQPFSQVVGASPLIRMRLGDLIKSNYSKFALARLFGVGSPASFKYKNSQNSQESQEFSGAQEKIKQFQDKLKSAKEKVGTYLSLSKAGWPAYTKTNSITIGSTTKTATTLNIDEEDLQYFVFKIEETNIISYDAFDKPSVCLVVKPFVNFIVDQKIISALANKYNNPENTSRYLKLDNDPAKYYIPLNSNAISLAKEEIQKIYSEVFSQDISSVEAIAEFLSSENNAIVRSFESVKGKGLAGKIDSLAFDWYDKVVWETKRGSVAPKICKITLSFSPIHDISPGLDHMGYNRAPVYKIGSSNGEEGNE